MAEQEQVPTTPESTEPVTARAQKIPKPDEIVSPLGEGESDTLTEPMSVPAPPAEVPASEPEPKEEPKPPLDEGRVKELEDQLARAQDAIKFVQSLESDPGAVEVLSKYMEDKGYSDQSAETPADSTTEITQLKAQIQALQTSVAGLAAHNEVLKFFRGNPDAQTMEADMTELAKKYPAQQDHFSSSDKYQQYLSDIFTLAKAKKGGLGQQPQLQLQATETETAAAPSDDGLSEVLKRISAAKDNEAAVKIAFEHAQRQAGGG